MLLALLVLCAITSPLLAKKKQKKAAQSQVIVQAEPSAPMPLLPLPTPGMPAATPGHDMPTMHEQAAAHIEVPQPPVPMTAPEKPAPTLTPASEVHPVITPVVSGETTKKEEKSEELKMALDRLASLEQKFVSVEAKLSGAEQRLAKMESQLTSFINELSAPSPEDEEVDITKGPVDEDFIPASDEDAAGKTL